MEPLLLGSEGQYEVRFSLHLRAPDPLRRADRSIPGPVPGNDDHGYPECTSWITLDLRSRRRPIADVEESVRVEPTPTLRVEDGPALRRCTARALAFLPAVFRCDPQDREDLTDDDPHDLMVFMEPPDYETVVAILGYYVLGFGAAYPFMNRDPGREKIRRLVEGLSELPTP